MRWWFIIKSLQTAIFGTDVNEIDENDIEMYVCSLCRNIYLDKKSYITHYQVNACMMNSDTLPTEPIKIRTEE
jgi:hypothetical protein